MNTAELFGPSPEDAKARMMERGIQTSPAHFWCHVSPLDRAVYMYHRKTAMDELESLHEVAIRSAVGRLLPIRSFITATSAVRLGCPWVQPGAGWLWAFLWARKVEHPQLASDNDYGRWAEDLVKSSVLTGALLWLPAAAVEKASRDEDISGIDFWPTLKLGTRVSIEVKYDGRCGINGTGNLFLQTHEYGHLYNKRHAHKTDAPH